jgi:hypothetical protein
VGRDGSERRLDWLWGRERGEAVSNSKGGAVRAGTEGTAGSRGRSAASTTCRAGNSSVGVLGPNGGRNGRRGWRVKEAEGGVLAE